MRVKFEVPFLSYEHLTPKNSGGPYTWPWPRPFFIHFMGSYPYWSCQHVCQIWRP